MQRLTPESAVSILVSWITENGRDPKAHECCKKNGLPHRTTLLYGCGFSSYSKVLEAAHEQMSLSHVPGESTCNEIRSSLCMGGCGETVTYKRKEPVRHCDECRKNLFSTDPSDEEPVVKVDHSWFIIAVDWGDDFDELIDF